MSSPSKSHLLLALLGVVLCIFSIFIAFKISYIMHFECHRSADKQVSCQHVIQYLSSQSTETIHNPQADEFELESYTDEYGEKTYGILFKRKRISQRITPSLSSHKNKVIHDFESLQRFVKSDVKQGLKIEQNQKAKGLFIGLFGFLVGLLLCAPWVKSWRPK